MKNILLLLIAACGMAVCGCNKENEVNAKAILPGTWIMSEVGIDYNQNQSVDEGETMPISATILYDTIIFRQDDTYTSRYNDGRGDITESGTYSYSDNRIYLMTSPSDSDYLPLTSLTKNKFISDIGDTWHIYTKIY